MRSIRQAYQLNESRACGLVGITRWINPYQSRRDPQEELRQRLRELAGTFGMQQGGTQYRRLMAAFQRIFGATIFLRNGHTTSESDGRTSSKIQLHERSPHLVIAEPHSYCVVILHDGLRIVSLDGRAKIEARVTVYLKAIVGRKPTDRAAADVYGELLRPIGDAVRKKALLIVRDGVLHLLPFDALRDLSGPYVGEESVVSYLPSAASFYLLARQKNGPEPRRRELFAVGGVPYASALDQIKKLVALRGVVGQNISNLPNSTEEIFAAGT